MCRKGIGVVAWQAEGRGSVADEAAERLHYLLRKFPLPHVVQQLCWYQPVKGLRHVE